MTRIYSKTAIVIGGGFSGLASAALLARQGWKVTLIEKNSSLGGRARVMKKGGFSFDMGPSWYMMPEIFEDFFGLFGKKVSDFYTLKRLDPRYQIFFGEHDSMVLHDDVSQNQVEFEKRERGAGQRLKNFLQKQKVLYELTTKKLLLLDVFSIGEWFKVKNLLAIGKLLQTTWVGNNWHQEVLRYFKHPRLQQILEFPSVFLGGSPFTTPGIFSMLSWADFGAGIWYPLGGMGRIVDALERVCQEYGVEIVTDAEVSGVEIQDGRIVSVRTQQARYPADVVVGACDIASFETKIVPDPWQSYPKSFWERKIMGISALLLYVGLDTKIPGLPHHSLYFSPDWKENFESIFTLKQIPEDPSFYISARSVTDDTIAPAGCEELFVLVPLGARTDYSSQDFEKLKERVLQKMETLTGVPIRKHIKVVSAYTPQNFANDYQAYSGTALGLAHTWAQSLWGRPANKSRKISNLYYAGQYTNPGVGVPMALVSAQITARLIGSVYRSSEDIFKRGSTTYYYSSLFFRGQIKKDVFTLYAYVRTIDDFVDVGVADTESFEQFWEQTSIAWKGKPSGNVIVDSFVELAKRKKFAWKWISAFWEAMRSDFKKHHYTNFAELETYMYGSAEVIGLMMARILDLPKESEQAARLQGKAMQFLNFIRDVEEDRAMGRNYLGYDAAIIADSHQWSNFLRTQLDIYFELQKKAEAGYMFIPHSYLIPIQTAAKMYSWTASEIYQDPMIVWSRKVKPSKYRVVWEIMKNYIGI